MWFGWCAERKKKKIKVKQEVDGDAFCDEQQMGQLMNSDDGFRW